MFDYDSDNESSESDSVIILLNEDISESESESESDEEQEPEVHHRHRDNNNNDDDEIYQEDSAHLYSEKIDGCYYIGLAKRLYCNNLLMVNSVSPTVFFRYPFQQVRSYLVKYSSLRVETPKIHIMKLCITDDEIFTVVLKTHWLRLIQRHWKKVYSEKKRFMSCRCNVRNLHTRELCGKFPVGLRNLPGLGGMLECYK